MAKSEGLMQLDCGMVRRLRSSWGVMAVALAVPALAHASVGDEILGAFDRLVRWFGMFGGGAMVLSWGRVGYTYLWSDHPEKTMERVKNAVIGSLIIMGAVGIAALFKSLFSGSGY